MFRLCSRGGHENLPHLHHPKVCDFSSPAVACLFQCFGVLSTPEKPVHCVVWAKELYKLLFSDPKTSMMYEDNFDDSVYMKHVRCHAGMTVRPSTAHRRVCFLVQIGLPEASASPAEIEAYAERVFTLMFRDEIQFRLEMKADSYKVGNSLARLGCAWMENLSQLLVLSDCKIQTSSSRTVATVSWSR
jgi:hypothetical protein